MIPLFNIENDILLENIIFSYERDYVFGDRIIFSEKILFQKIEKIEKCTVIPLFFLFPKDCHNVLSFKKGNKFTKINSLICKDMCYKIPVFSDNCV